MNAAVELAVDVAAVHRLTRLATEDVITKGLRDDVIRSAYARGNDRQRMHASTYVPDIEWQQIVDDDPEPPKLATLVTCRWCASVWIGSAVGVVRRRRLVSGVMYGLALSSLSTLLATLED